MPRPKGPRAYFILGVPPFPYTGLNEVAWIAEHARVQSRLTPTHKLISIPCGCVPILNTMHQRTALTLSVFLLLCIHDVNSRLRGPFGSRFRLRKKKRNKKVGGGSVIKGLTNIKGFTNKAGVLSGATKFCFRRVQRHWVDDCDSRSETPKSLGPTNPVEPDSTENTNNNPVGTDTSNPVGTDSSNPVGTNTSNPIGTDTSNPNDPVDIPLRKSPYPPIPEKPEKADGDDPMEITRNTPDPPIPEPPEMPGGDDPVEITHSVPYPPIPETPEMPGGDDPLEITHSVPYPPIPETPEMPGGDDPMEITHNILLPPPPETPGGDGDNTDPTVSGNPNLPTPTVSSNWNIPITYVEPHCDMAIEETVMKIDTSGDLTIACKTP